MRARSEAIRARSEATSGSLLVIVLSDILLSLRSPLLLTLARTLGTAMKIVGFTTFNSSVRVLMLPVEKITLAPLW